MRLSLLKKSLFAAPVLLAACQSREFGRTEPDALKGVKTSDGAQLALSFSDLNPESAKARMGAAMRGAKRSEIPDEESSDCILPDGNLIANNEADLAADNSTVYYCKDGVAKKASENRFLKELVQEAGGTEEELNDVKIYLVPLKIANAWANSPKQGRGHIVVYQGLMKYDFTNPSYRPVKDDGALAAVIVHELGHIKDMRKVGFTNLNDRDESLRRYCSQDMEKAKTQEEYIAKKNTCYLRIQAQTRAYEHSADANIPITFKRKLPNLTLNPYKIGEWFDALGIGKTRATASHPDGKERKFYLTKALQEAGIPKDIPARESTVKALVSSIAD